MLESPLINQENTNFDEQFSLNDNKKSELDLSIFNGDSEFMS